MYSRFLWITFELLYRETVSYRLHHYQVYSQIDLSSFSRLPNVYANPQPTTLTAQSAKDAPLTAPLTVNLFLSRCHQSVYMTPVQ
jgi:hypothetical protein